MYEVSIGGLVRPQIEVRVLSPSSADFLAGTSDPGRVSLVWQDPPGFVNWLGDPVVVTRISDGVEVLRGQVEDQSWEVTSSGTVMELDTSDDLPVALTWPTAFFEDPGRFGAGVKGLMPYIFGSVHRAELIEVVPGVRCLSRNPLRIEQVGVYDDSNTLLANEAIKPFVDFLGEAFYGVEVDEALEGQTLYAGPVVGYLPDTPDETVTLESLVRFTGRLVRGGWAVGGQPIPPDLASIPLGVIINAQFRDVARELLDRLARQLSFTVQLQGGWAFGPDLGQQPRMLAGDVSSVKTISTGRVNNVRVRWGHGLGDTVGVETLPDSDPYVVASRHLDLGVEEVEAQDIPTAGLASFLARRRMRLHGTQRTRWVVQAVADQKLDIGMAVDLSALRSRPEGLPTVGWVEEVDRGESVDTVKVLVLG